jgi:hypothetical protein
MSLCRSCTRDIGPDEQVRTRLESLSPTLSTCTPWLRAWGLRTSQRSTPVPTRMEAWRWSRLYELR